MLSFLYYFFGRWIFHSTCSRVFPNRSACTRHVCYFFLDTFELAGHLVCKFMFTIFSLHSPKHYTQHARDQLGSGKFDSSGIDKFRVFLFIWSRLSSTLCNYLYPIIFLSGIPTVFIISSIYPSM